MRRVFDHAGLLVGRKEEDAKAFGGEGEGGKDFVCDAEIGIAEVGGFKRFGHAESETAEGGDLRFAGAGSAGQGGVSKKKNASTGVREGTRRGGDRDLAPL